jgi:branched-chain amino acid transport system substrate-binding protein
MTAALLSRRMFLATAVAGTALAEAPVPLRAQPKTIRIGAIHPVSGALAEVGQLQRTNALIAVDAINATGGVKSMGGAKLELLVADSESKPEVARSSAERLITDGAAMITGGFHSGHIMGMVPVAQQRRVPFIIDVGAADAITQNVAQSVREGKQKTQYVYRIFPSTTTFGVRAVQNMVGVFTETKVTPKRVAVMYTNDAFGRPQSEAFVNAVKASHVGFEIVEVIAYPEDARDLSTEVSRLKAARPDILSPITRPATAALLFPELARQRVPLMGVVSPGAPGMTQPKQLEMLKEHLEYVMVSVPWPNFKSPRTQRAADEYMKRVGTRSMDETAFTYDALQVMADVLERARSTDADALVDAIKKTSFNDPIMISAGAIRFNENGDNIGATTAMVQILQNAPKVVWPKEMAQAPMVFPRPKL